MKTAFCILALVLFIEKSFAEIIYVPSDFYPTPFFGVAAANEGDTVIVAPGEYLGGVLFSNVNVVLASEYLLTGNPFAITGTVLNGDFGGHVIQISGSEINETTQIVGLTITGGTDFSGGGIYCVGASPVIRDNIIADNFADAGGGIYCSGGSPKILRNTIRGNQIISPIGNPGGGICCINDSDAEIAYNVIWDNQNQDGAGIACVNSDPWIHHNVIVGNQAFDLGGAIRCDFSSPMIEYNVMADNTAGTGGAFAILLSSSPTIRNCILWGNNGAQIHASGSSPTVAFSNVQGSWPGENNINSDPLFRNPEALDYHLSYGDCGPGGNSSCVDAGYPEEFDSTDFCNWGLGETRADMGAYGGLGDSTISHADISPVVESHLICSAYPNPFNASTTLEFSLPMTSTVNLSVFNTLGQVVYHRGLGQFNSGTHSHYFNGENLTTGFYIARLETPVSTVSTKLLLLK